MARREVHIPRKPAVPYLPYARSAQIYRGESHHETLVDRRCDICEARPVCVLGFGSHAGNDKESDGSPTTPAELCRTGPQGLTRPCSSYTFIHACRCRQEKPSQNSPAA